MCRGLILTCCHNFESFLYISLSTLEGVKSWLWLHLQRCYPLITHVTVKVLFILVRLMLNLIYISDQLKCDVYYLRGRQRKLMRQRSLCCSFDFHWSYLSLSCRHWSTCNNGQFNSRSIYLRSHGHVVEQITEKPFFKAPEKTESFSRIT